MLKWLKREVISVFDVHTNRLKKSSKKFEWKVNFVAEGVFPSKLPKTLNDKCVLAELEGNAALLSVKVFRDSIPSNAEVQNVKKIAVETATELANLYSLFIAPLKIVMVESLEQITPYEGKKYATLKQLRVPFKIDLPDEEWDRRFNEFKESKNFPTRDYLSLALSHYRLARTLGLDLKSEFLNLMICIESLYNKDPQEIRFRISTRIANLLGRTEELRKKIYTDMLYLYKKRNDIIHGLKPVAVSNEDMQLLLTYSKTSLIAFLKLGQKKKTILDEIDEVIFDNKKREQIQEQIKDILEKFEKGNFVFRTLRIKAVAK